MTRKHIVTPFFAMTLAAIFFFFTSPDETHAQSHNTANNNAQLVRDTQLLLSLYDPLVGLDGRCGPETKKAIEKYAEKLSGACSVNVLETLKYKIRSAIMRDKLAGSTPFATADIHPLSAKIDAMKDDVNKRLEAMTIDVNDIKSDLKAVNDSISLSAKIDAIKDDVNKKLEAITIDVSDIKSNLKSVSSRGTGSVMATVITITAIAITVYLSVFIYIKSMRKSGAYLWGAPILDEDRKTFIANIIERFTKGIPNPEAAVLYLDNITDRIITKAVGLLQYNAVVLAITYVISYPYINALQFPQMELLLLWASIACSIFSTFFVILVLFTHWRRKGYQEPLEDVEEIARLCMRRSIIITLGIIFGWFAMLCDIAFYVHIMLTNH